MNLRKTTDIQTMAAAYLPFPCLLPHQCFRKAYLPNKLSHKILEYQNLLLGESKPKQIWTSCMRILSSVSWVTGTKNWENRWSCSSMRCKEKNMLCSREAVRWVKWHKLCTGMMERGSWREAIRTGWAGWEVTMSRKYKMSCGGGAVDSFSASVGDLQ